MRPQGQHVPPDQRIHLHTVTVWYSFWSWIWYVKGLYFRPHSTSEFSSILSILRTSERLSFRSFAKAKKISLTFCIVLVLGVTFDNGQQHFLCQKYDFFQCGAVSFIQVDGFFRQVLHMKWVLGRRTHTILPVCYTTGGRFNVGLVGAQSKVGVARTKNITFLMWTWIYMIWWCF